MRRAATGRSAPPSSPAARPGFTLVELMVVIMIVGILAGLAIPDLREARLRADATRVVADARAVGLAAHDFLSQNGRFPDSGAPGQVPPELAEGLDGVSFDYKGLTYSWYSFSFSAWQGWSGRNLGVFVVEYGDQQGIGNALSAFTGPDAYWSENMYYVLFWD